MSSSVVCYVSSWMLQLCSLILFGFALCYTEQKAKVEEEKE